MKRSGLNEESKRYWDDHPIGAEGIEAGVGSPEFFKEYVERYDRFYDYKRRVFEYPKYRDQRVLEIGCGLGIDSYKFAEQDAQLTCIDLSDTAVRNTRKLLEMMKLEANVLQGDAERLAFPAGYFDAVYAYGVLMHVGDDGRALDEIFRVLRPGGEALVVLYHRRSWFWLLKSLSGTRVESELGDPPIIRVYTVREVRQLFHRFSRLDLSFERFPQRTLRRKGLKAFLYNWVFVPVTKIIPRPLLRPFGWHIVVKAVK